MTTVLFVIAIFCAIWFTSLIIGGLIAKNSIPAWNFILMAAALTAVITHIIGIW